jgi:hypothetical protein
MYVLHVFMRMDVLTLQGMVFAMYSTMGMSASSMHTYVLIYFMFMQTGKLPLDVALGEEVKALLREAAEGR